jgi:hypothetical protein
MNCRAFHPQIGFGLMNARWTILEEPADLRRAEARKIQPAEREEAIGVTYAGTATYNREPPGLSMTQNPLGRFGCRLAVVSLCAGAVLAPPLLAQAPDAPAAPAAVEVQPHQVRPYQRIIEENDGARVALQMAVREFLPPREGMPPIHMAAAVHIGNPEFYGGLQEFLDGHELVLFEGVKPPGAGDPAMDLEHERTDAQRIKATERRVRFLAMAVERYREENDRYPETREELAAGLDGRFATLVAGATTDAWGGELLYIRQEKGFDIVSLGADGAAGGEGAAADIRYGEQKPVGKSGRGSGGGGIQKKLADTLGLVFQLEAMDHDKPNWRNSDLSVDQVQERLERSGGNADGLLRMLDGSSALSRVLGFVLDMMASSPNQRAMLRMMVIETIGVADRLLEQAPGGAGAMMQVILEDRNQVVIADLEEVLAAGDAPESIAIIYGGGHLPGLERDLVHKLGYRAGETTWRTAMHVDAEEMGLPVEQFRRSRQMISQMVQRQIDRGGGRQR